ncbi:hypothetical protein CVT26_009853 [Gymnopilus dilepis]|uniref:Uncharacterized protein n=1 Tax=Gymnopilus dilepis TaxID=231916 RepID=A0A409YC47_9AGAR|nr:hypothetical protein CVT26_009853 [Gymnopilus dilepis]
MTDKKSPEQLLKEWRNICFLDEQLTMTEAADSLIHDKREPLVEARPKPGSNGTNWSLYNTVRNDEAILVHAGIWNSSTPLDTGNFVPEGEKTAASIPRKRVQRAIGFKCDVSYRIDTSLDESIWDNLKTFECHAETLENFNVTKRDRSNYQDGSRREMYIMAYKLFTRTFINPPEPEFAPHEWLSKAVAAQKWQEWAINPDKPKFYDLVNGVLVDLGKSNPPEYKKGDIVWFAFKVTFYIGKESWSPEIVPIEFVRVVSGKGLYSDTVEIEAPVNGTTEAEVLTAPPKRLEEGQSITCISREQVAGKRKVEDRSDSETLASSSTSGGTTEETANCHDDKDKDESDNHSDPGTTASSSMSSDVAATESMRKDDDVKGSNSLGEKSDLDQLVPLSTSGETAEGTMNGSPANVKRKAEEYPEADTAVTSSTSGHASEGVANKKASNAVAGTVNGEGKTQDGPRKKTKKSRS